MKVYKSVAALVVAILLISGCGAVNDVQENTSENTETIEVLKTDSPEYITTAAYQFDEPIRGCVRCFLENDNICVPGFYEGEQLPLGYFDPPDPYTNISSRKINLGELANYMQATGKSFRELTKEDLKMFEQD